ncbi:MAG: PPOX class F420-dependent oxidoreductase [Actinobacteria bacterium]|nr:MAG: PPOX class F420-dependent oxidoreductase [Actinomycetota bacterium]
MSIFSTEEIDYMASQRLGRIATVGRDGQPHVVPTSFRYNAEQDAIDVGGLRMSQTKKFRDVGRTGRASIVIDDVQPPWKPRMIEIRGRNPLPHFVSRRRPLDRRYGRSNGARRDRR